MLTGMNADELRRALGGIVIESAYLERVLRTAFSALIGSKYVAVVDGRMQAHTLIEDCQHIARVHPGIADDAKAMLAAALSACDESNRRRNRVIHDAWAYRPRAVMVSAQGHHDSQQFTVTRQELDDLDKLAGQIATAAASLADAIAAALGEGSLRVEDQLRLELGRDIAVNGT
jgi:hypothetical protein